MADPKRKALMKPFELLGISAVFGLFVAGVIFYTTRNGVVALIAAGGTFVVAVVVLAMLVLSYKPNEPVVHYLDRFDEDAPRIDGDDGETPAPAAATVSTDSAPAEGDVVEGAATGVDETEADVARDVVAEDVVAEDAVADEPGDDGDDDPTRVDVTVVETEIVEVDDDGNVEIVVVVEVVEDEPPAQLPGEQPDEADERRER